MRKNLSLTGAVKLKRMKKTEIQESGKLYVYERLKVG